VLHGRRDGGEAAENVKGVCERVRGGGEALVVYAIDLVWPRRDLSEVDDAEKEVDHSLQQREHDVHDQHDDEVDAGLQNQIERSRPHQRHDDRREGGRELGEEAED
jgi:hypothetical protein